MRTSARPSRRSPARRPCRRSQRCPRRLGPTASRPTSRRRPAPIPRAPRRPGQQTATKLQRRPGRFHRRQRAGWSRRAAATTGFDAMWSRWPSALVPSRRSGLPKRRVDQRPPRSVRPTLQRLDFLRHCPPPLPRWTGRRAPNRPRRRTAPCRRRASRCHRHLRRPVRCRASRSRHHPGWVDGPLLGPPDPPAPGPAGSEVSLATGP